ncbi:MAG: tryptophan--tRNA ligase, partial [Candidatus Omnitrophica bacterium]|nr:tryptophan--tRNA ligase [Candidatus Omnitrophota bacterium]
WLSAGIDPSKSTVFIQSEVPQHLELYMIFSCLVPLGWLERCPTYKEQLRQIKTRNLNTYGFLGYPVLQAADILLYKAEVVPVGEDQLPHLELTREISRRFNHFYKKDIFSEPKALLTESPRLLGLDGRKMSKSYNNTINLSDPPEVIQKKISTMFTDPKRVRLKDPGHPKGCNVFSYYRIFGKDKVSEVEEWCTQAKKGCTDCKRKLAELLIEYLRPIQEKRKIFLKNKDEVKKILRTGKEKARSIAEDTIAEIKQTLDFLI